METLVPINSKELEFLRDLAKRIFHVSNDAREGAFLSDLIRTFSRFKSVAVRGTSAHNP